MVSSLQFLIHTIDPRHQHPHRRQQPQTGTKVHQSDLFSVEAIDAAVDILEVGVQAVCGAEYQRLVERHRQHDRLGEDAKGSRERLPQLHRHRSQVFAFVPEDGVAVILLMLLFAPLQQDGRIRLAEEEKARACVDAAHYGKYQEYPTPAQPLDDRASDHWSQRWPKKWTEKIPSKYSGSLLGMKHVAEGASAVGDPYAAEEAGYGAQSNHGLDVLAECCGDLQDGEQCEAGEVQSPAPKGLRQRCQNEWSDAQHHHEARRGADDRVRFGMKSICNLLNAWCEHGAGQRT